MRVTDNIQKYLNWRYSACVLSYTNI